MAILPRYQKTGIKVRQPSSMDFAAARESQRLGQTIAQQLDRMGEFAFRQAAEVAEQRGVERVRQEGAVPVLEQLQGQDEPRTIAEQAAFDAANKIAVVEIETAARSDMRTLIQQADETNMSMSVFNDRMSDIQDGYTASLQVVNPVAAGVLNARLQEDSVSFNTRYSEIVSRKAKAAWAAKTEEILNDGVQAIQEIALQEGVTEDQINTAGAKLLETAQTRGVSEKKAQNLVDRAVNAAIRENLYYRLNNAAGIPEKQAILAEISEQETFPGMNYEQTRNLEERIGNDITREINAGRTEFVENLQDALLYITHTGQTPEGFGVDEANLSVLFAEDQDTLDGLLRSLEFAEQDALTYGALSTMSVAEANKAVSEMKADYESPAPGTTGAELASLQQRYETFQAAVADRANRVNADPAQYVLDTNPEARKFAEGAMRDIAEGNLEAAAFNLQGLGITLKKTYDKIGVSESARQIMSKGMSQQLVQNLESIAESNPDLAVSFFQQYRNAFGDDSIRFVDELNKAGLKPEFTEAMMTNDPGLHDMLMKVSQTDAADIKKLIDKTDASDAMADLQTTLTEYTSAFIQGGDVKAQEDLASAMGVAEKLLYQYMAQTGKSGADAAKWVASRLFPEFENVVSNENGSYIVPLEFNKNTVSAKLGGQIMNPETLQKLGIKELDVTDAPGYIDEAISFANLARKGVFVNNSTGDGVVLHYRTDTGYLIQAEMADGSGPVDIKFKDLDMILKELQGAAVEVGKVEPAGADQAMAPGFEPGAPGYEAGMAALQEAQPVTPAAPRAEPVSAEERVKRAETNRKKVIIFNRYMDRIPESATSAEKNEYYQFLLYELRKPDFPSIAMTQFRTFKDMKESGEYERVLERRSKQGN